MCNGSLIISILNRKSADLLHIKIVLLSILWKIQKKSIKTENLPLFQLTFLFIFLRSLFHFINTCKDRILFI